MSFCRSSVYFLFLGGLSNEKLYFPIFRIFRFAGDPKTLSNLLEILTVLPEEINSRSLRLGESRRRQITDDLSSNFPFLFQFLVRLDLFCLFFILSNNVLDISSILPFYFVFVLECVL